MAIVFPKLDLATKLDANYLQMYALPRASSVQIAQTAVFFFFLVLPGTVVVHTEGGGGGG